MTFSDDFVISQNKMAASVGSLYRKPLGEVVFCYDSGCIIEKVRHVQYNKI